MKIRKNITIRPNEDYLLKQMAKEFNVSQSDLIGEAIVLMSRSKKITKDRIMFVVSNFEKPGK